ncbi:ABC-three component system middle component 6 [Bacillus paralicheniformis]|uniref:ABC-three component system middle component 6 n=1 Tax=Bacillus paralicheniformis TaxID=1648923 RepID=UPI00295F2788|nr:ABC-three component system middle component 6 [Bacillus paralicheniformis]
MHKYQSLEENLLYDAKVLYSLLDDNKQKHIDELFSEFAQRQGIELNVNIERVLFLSLSFLYSTGLITSDNNMIKRVKK